jgi:hypothetical protein
MQTIRTNDLASATGGAALWAPRFGYYPYAGYYTPYAYPAAYRAPHRPAFRAAYPAYWAAPQYAPAFYW